jgi:hypothetical protein
MVEKWVPDIVVGIDFGMTCTGSSAISIKAAMPDPPSSSQQSQWQQYHQLT